MTRAEAFQRAAEIVEEIGEREIEKYLARHGYDAEDEVRREVAQWKATQLAEIEKQMSAMVRSMLH